ncbi:MAG: hypothetical protein ABIQ95_00010 [Bdellovibrionia bacterium]
MEIQLGKIDLFFSLVDERCFVVLTNLIMGKTSCEGREFGRDWSLAVLEPTLLSLY